MEGSAVRPLTLQLIEGHDVLLESTHDLLDSIVELSGQHNQEPNGSHIYKMKTLYKTDLDMIQSLGT